MVSGHLRQSRVISGARLSGADSAAGRSAARRRPRGRVPRPFGGRVLRRGAARAAGGGGGAAATLASNLPRREGAAHISPHLPTSPHISRGEKALLPSLSLASSSAHVLLFMSGVSASRRCWRRCVRRRRSMGRCGEMWGDMLRSWRRGVRRRRHTVHARALGRAQPHLARAHQSRLCRL